ncbi:kinase-like domain-containing protein [Geopyxis carbonaria]|nr:kinase-like domain-containing protein [Geopyxis carbonaria]
MSFSTPTMASGSSNNEKAQLVRDHSEKSVRQEMEDVPADIPYTVLELIGKGSFGSVYKAIHNETKQLYAVKSLDLDQHDEEIKDIQKEIGLLSHLKAGDAPNITNYHGSYLLGTRLWVIIDFCSGGSMRTLMKAGPIAEKFICIVVRETLTALGYLHKNGIIHRDIKAANILVNQDGRVQLCDFGVSAQIAGKNGKRQTFVGTPQWMAPEALSGGLYDSRIDIWSFGITVIEMAKQNPPLHNVLPHRAVDIIPKLPPPRLEGGTWSNALREFVALCLNEVPEDRATVEELQKSKLVRAAKAPTTVMRELITRYELWERGGGVRGSMLYGIGMGQDQDPGDTISDPDWDFDTIKSRASGVPKEWEMVSRQATLRAPQRTPLWGGPRPRGAAEELGRLFEDPKEEEWNDASTLVSDPHSNNEYRTNTIQSFEPPPEPSGGLNFISIPSFDDDGMIMSDAPPPQQQQSFIQSMYQAPPARAPSPVRQMGQIFMPSEEEMIQMAQEKARAAAALPIPVPPPSAPLPMQGMEKPRTRLHRADSAGASVLRPVEIGPPASPRRDGINRETSPRRQNMIPASAPSSPPRTSSNLGIHSTASTTNGHKSHHLPSKSVPNFHGRRGHTEENAPPMPVLRGIPKMPSTESTPVPHVKSRSQDVTARPRPGGRMMSHKPSNLNLGPPNSNFSSGQGRNLPPSPSRPAYNHTPQSSVGSMPRMGMGMSNGHQTPHLMDSMNFPRLGSVIPDALAGNVVLMQQELDRILGGMGDALEVMEVGLKKLSKARELKVPADVEE